MERRDRHWKKTFQKLVDSCQQEVKRTTEIGKKMLSASKTNSCLHESYESLGAYTLKAIKDGTLEWDDPKVRELIEKIEVCEKDLEDIESEVNKIRFSAGPVDVSKDSSKMSQKSSNSRDSN